MVQIHAKGYQLDTHTYEMKFGKFAFNYLIMNKDIHHCERYWSLVQPIFYPKIWKFVFVIYKFILYFDL